MDPTLSEVRLFAGNYEPLSWQFCKGQLMSIAINTALYSLLGTTYGGDGQTSFALPDLQGRVPVGTGAGPGLPAVDLGDVWGAETTVILSSQMPAHTHMLLGAGAAPITGTITATMNVNTTAGSGDNPTGSFLGTDGSGSGLYAATATSGATLNTSAIQLNTNGLSVNLAGQVQIGISGSSQPINLMQPYLALNYIIAVEGIYPSRN
jgi:microcystin-dependent protein